MQAIAISGSPRAAGNTDTLLRRCLMVLEHRGLQTELVSLRGKTIRPCRACGTCADLKDGTCSIKDDDFQPVLNSMRVADILVVGSPVYFGSATPELMALLDRAGYVSRQCGGFFSRKVGGPIAVARRAGHNFTYAQLLFFFMIMGMVVPGSTYWPIAFGRTPGEVTKDEEGMKTVATLAENIAWLLKKVR